MKHRKTLLSVRWGLAGILYYIWFQTFYNAVRFGKVFPYADFTDMLVGVSYNLPPILLVFLFNLLIVFRIVRISNLTLKIVIDFTVSVAGACLVNGLYLVVYGCLHDDPVTVDWAGSILNDIIILMGIELVYYSKHLMRSREETEEAHRKALQYRYDALKAQINPHFLFNSLNLLHSLVSIDQAKSKSFIYSFAIMYRYVLAKHNTDKVDAKEEFEFLESYISPSFPIKST